jgi:hypothetical protein
VSKGSVAEREGEGLETLDGQGRECYRKCFVAGYIRLLITPYRIALSGGKIRNRAQTGRKG